MCLDPATLIVGALGAAVQFAGQMQQYKQNKKNALQAFRNDQETLSLRQIQEDDASSQKVQQLNLEEAKATSAARVSAAGGGVAGVSIGNIIGDITRNASRSRENERRNANMAREQLQLNKKGSRAQAQSRINAVPRPSALSLVAGIAGAGLDSYNAYQRRQLGATA